MTKPIIETSNTLRFQIFGYHIVIGKINNSYEDVEDFKENYNT